MSIKEDLFSQTVLHAKFLRKLLEPAKQFFGASSGGLVYVDSNDNMVNLHTSVEWIERCIAKNYFLYESHIVHPSRMGTGFALNNFIEPTGNVFIDGLNQDARNFGMADHLTYVKRYEQSYFAFWCDSKEKNLEMANKILTHKECYIEFCAHVEKMLKPIMRDINYNKPVNIYELKGNLADLVGVVPGDQFKERVKFLNKIGKINECDRFIGDLTPIEISCLKLYIKGNTAEESAKLLNVSRRAIEWHFESIKNKLNCNYKKDLLEKANVLEILGIL